MNWIPSQKCKLHVLGAYIIINLLSYQTENANELIIKSSSVAATAHVITHMVKLEVTVHRRKVQWPAKGQ